MDREKNHRRQTNNNNNNTEMMEKTAEKKFGKKWGEGEKSLIVFI